MFVPKIPMDIHLRKHIGRTIGFCGHRPNPIVCLQYLSIGPEAELLYPAIGIDTQNCRPIIGPIAYSIGYYPECKKELNDTQTSRSKILQV